MSDDKFKIIYDGIQRELRNDSIYFELGAVSVKPDSLVVRIVRTDPQEAMASVGLALGRCRDILWNFTEVKPGSFQITVQNAPMLTEPPGIPFSSPDEFKGAEPLEIAIELVRRKAAELNVLAADYDPSAENFTVYPVWFTYVLGNWKAMVSTSIPDGRYYEVTDNKARGETYVDVYVKTSNTVIKHNI